MALAADRRAAERGRAGGDGGAADRRPGACAVRGDPQETGRAVGWTTYIATPGYADSIEIGWTWYGRAVWRSAVNTTCKILLIDHAFDKLGVNRVQLKTDNLNTRSQAAIRRIGGVPEGVLRRQRRRPDGTWRDTAYFSILDDEWPAHRARLTGSA